MYSNSCYSCSFEPEIIKIGLSSHKMYSNNIVNFQESTTILDAYTKMSGTLLKVPRIYTYIYEYMYICICMFMCVFMPIYVCMHICGYIHATYIYIYVCVCVCVCV